MGDERELIYAPRAQRDLLALRRHEVLGMMGQSSDQLFSTRLGILSCEGYAVVGPDSADAQQVNVDQDRNTLSGNRSFGKSHGLIKLLRVAGILLSSLVMGHAGPIPEPLTSTDSVKRRYALRDFLKNAATEQFIPIMSHLVAAESDVSMLEMMYFGTAVRLCLLPDIDWEAATRHVAERDKELPARLKRQLQDRQTSLSQLVTRAAPAVLTAHDREGLKQQIQGYVPALLTERSITPSAPPETELTLVSTFLWKMDMTMLVLGKVTGRDVRRKMYFEVHFASILEPDTIKRGWKVALQPTMVGSCPGGTEAFFTQIVPDRLQVVVVARLSCANSNNPEILYLFDRQNGAWKNILEYTFGQAGHSTGQPWEFAFAGCSPGTISFHTRSGAHSPNYSEDISTGNGGWYAPYWDVGGSVDYGLGSVRLLWQGSRYVAEKVSLDEADQAAYRNALKALIRFWLGDSSQLPDLLIYLNHDTPDLRAFISSSLYKTPGAAGHFPWHTPGIYSSLDQWTFPEVVKREMFGPSEVTERAIAFLDSIAWR